MHYPEQGCAAPLHVKLESSSTSIKDFSAMHHDQGHNDNTCMPLTIAVFHFAITSSASPSSTMVSATPTLASLPLPRLLPPVPWNQMNCNVHCSCDILDGMCSVNCLANLCCYGSCSNSRCQNNELPVFLLDFHDMLKLHSTPQLCFAFNPTPSSLHRDACRLDKALRRHHDAA